MFGDFLGLKFPDISLTGEKKSRGKNLTKKIVPTEDRIQVRCVRNARDHSGGRLQDLQGAAVRKLLKWQ